MPCRRKDAPKRVEAAPCPESFSDMVLTKRYGECMERHTGAQSPETVPNGGESATFTSATDAFDDGEVEEWSDPDFLPRSAQTSASAPAPPSQPRLPRWEDADFGSTASARLDPIELSPDLNDDTESMRSEVAAQLDRSLVADLRTEYEMSDEEAAHLRTFATDDYL